MELRDELWKMIDELPDGELPSVADFLGYLQAKREKMTAPVPDAESRTWLDAPFAPALEPFDWGPEGEPDGEPVYWDPKHGTYVVGEAGQ
jgi:hypothetical protein